jgi:hypothetical protein
MQVLELVFGHRAFGALAIIHGSLPLPTLNRAFKSLIKVHGNVA